MLGNQIQYARQGIWIIRRVLLAWVSNVSGDLHFEQFWLDRKLEEEERGLSGVGGGVAFERVWMMMILGVNYIGLFFFIIWEEEKKSAVSRNRCDLKRVGARR